MASYNLINTGSGNGLLAGGTKLSREPVLTKYQSDVMAFLSVQPGANGLI